MGIALAGVFDNTNDAQQARTRLLADGIPARDVRLTSAYERHAEMAAEEDHRGFFARMFGLGESDEHAGHYAEAVRRGSTVLTAHLDDESMAERVSDTLKQAGAIDVDRRVEEWRNQGYTGYDPGARAYSPEQTARERETFKVVEEDLQVGKRTVDRGGVRIRRFVTEKPVSADVNLREEKVMVERTPVDRPATSAELDSMGGAGRDVEIRETGEEPVVSKTARVVEEVRVGKEASERTEKVKDTVRRADVEVDKIPGSRKPSEPPRPHPR